MKTWNWGIIGLGKIARKFADDLKMLPNARLYAVASTSAERAGAFAAEYGAPHAFGSYEELVKCPDLDVVYVATPHVLHARNALLCLENGIPVLCEKPFSMNAAETASMIAIARKNGVFLMEALWTLFIPGVRYALELVEKGEIGRLHTVRSDFGFKMIAEPSSRIYNKALGGGSLLDIGIYPVLLSMYLFGKPEERDIQAAATFTPTGVDESCVFTFQYPGNRLAMGHSTIAARTRIDAWLYGSEGTIHLDTRWHHTKKIELIRYDGFEEVTEAIHLPYDGWGYHLEAAHVMHCLETGKTESEVVPLDFTLALSQTLDAIREKIGLSY